jgi:protease I
MDNRIKGKKIAILVDDFFEEAEMTGPRQALEKAGASVELITTETNQKEVQGLNHVEKGNKFKVDKNIDEVDLDSYDALVLPGGAVNSDKLRNIDKAKDWVRSMVRDGKPVAIICHAPWILASAGMAAGRRITSFPTIKDDLKNAGADWVDEEVVIDGTIITSRKPDDIPAFNKAIMSLL